MRWVALVLLVCLDAALLYRPSGGRALVIAAGPPAPRPTLAWSDPLAGLTADDVARGVWGLRREPGGLDAAQEAALQPLMARGAQQHSAISAARMAAREARAAWLADQGALGVELRDRWPGAVPARRTR